MSTPEISVIVPVYNVEDYLQQTLDSVMAQTFQDFELIVVNDGSTDDSLALAQAYRSNLPEPQQAKVTVLSQENQGLSGARITGMGNAKGRYLFFLDSDDLLGERCLEMLYEAAVQGKLDIIACEVVDFDDETGKTLGRLEVKSKIIEMEPGVDHLFSYSMCGRLIKKEFIDRYQLKPVVGEHIEDLSFSAAANLLTDKIGVLDYEGYRYRRRATSIMGNIAKRNSRPRLPYIGLKTAMEQVERYRPERADVNAYVMTKAMAGLLLNICSNCANDIRKEFCAFCYEMIGAHYPKIAKNPYIKIGKLKQLPMSHRLAVWLFVKSYQTKTMYAFTWLASRFLSY